MNNAALTTELTESMEAVKHINKLTELVIGCAIKVHRAVGPGLLESVYEICLCRELSLHNVPFECEKPLPLSHKGAKLDCGYRADLIVASKVLVEIKSVDQLLPIHEAQLLSYMKLGGFKVDLLINFNERVLTHGIRRKVLGPPDEVCYSSVSSVISVVK
jgi:GxxExxY protein